MKMIYPGKTKNVYALENGNYRLFFKDDMTGKDGVFDPGANEVGLRVEGMGRKNLLVSAYFFEKLKKEGVKTHYISHNPDEATMDVLPGTPFGKGLEIICRYRAVGSFIRRYGAYFSGGEKLEDYVEATLKDDERGDPLVTREGLKVMGIMEPEEFDRLKEITLKISGIIKEALAEKGLELYDIKLEFGRGADGSIMLMDELSSGNMRVYRDGQALSPTELSDLILQ